MTLPVAYVAGLIDGEGCIWINKTNRGYYSPVVTVGMTSRALMILESLKEQYGGSVNPHSRATKKWDASYAWRVSGTPAVAMLREILPELMLKPQQARLAIRLQEIKDQHGGKFSPCVAERCEKIKQRMHMLNARGPRTPEPEPPTGYRKIAQLVAGLWVTDQGDLFSDTGLEPFRGTWPKSGMVRSGVLYEPVTSEHRTGGSESSYLPTPTAQLNEPAPWKPGVDWWLQSRATRNLEGVVTGNTPLMPTPRAQAGGGAGIDPPDRDSPNLATVVSLLPTPDATHMRKTTRTSPLLHDIDRLLPTPAAGAFNDGEDLESWEARRDRELAKGYNGNGQGTPLTIAVQKMMPTPTPSDGTGGHSSRSGDRRSERLLGGLAKDLLPTPTVGDSKSARNSTASRNKVPPTGVHAGDTLTDSVSLLPTPQAHDAKAMPGKAAIASGNYHGNLGPAVTGMLPTPNSRDWKGSPSSAWEGQASLPREVTRIGEPEIVEIQAESELPGQLGLEW